MEILTSSASRAFRPESSINSAISCVLCMFAWRYQRGSWRILATHDCSVDFGHDFFDLLGEALKEQLELLVIV